jgi:putative heme iron utilization protein
MESNQRAAILALLLQQRWAALATTSADGPDATWVAYVPLNDGSELLLHLSRLAHHTRNLQQNPQATLTVSEPDDGREDPQTLARCSLSGLVREVGRNDPEWPTLRDQYLASLPAATPRFEFADFSLYLLHPQRGWWVGGFGQARRFPARSLWQTGGAT